MPGGSHGLAADPPDAVQASTVRALWRRRLDARIIAVGYGLAVVLMAVLPLLSLLRRIRATASARAAPELKSAGAARRVLFSAFDLGAALSLLLFVFTCTAWVRSRRGHADAISFLWRAL